MIFNEHKCGFEESSQVEKEPEPPVLFEFSDEPTEAAETPVRSDEPTEAAETPVHTVRRSDRQTRPPDFYGYHCNLSQVSVDTGGGLIGYSDADWAGDVNDRKSTSGYLFMMNGAAVSWRSQKQTCVALSTAEAEYIALAAAAQEATWMRKLMKDFHESQAEPVTIYEDNQSAICIAKNPQSHHKTKHVDIKYHYVRDKVQDVTIKIQYCPTNDMIADILTKGLDARPIHSTLCPLRSETVRLRLRSVGNMTFLSDCYISY